MPLQCNGCNDPIPPGTALTLPPLPDFFCEPCYINARETYDTDGQLQVPHSFTPYSSDLINETSWCRHCNTTPTEIPGMHFTPDPLPEAP